MNKIQRVFVEKKPEWAADAGKLLCELREQLNVSGLDGVRIVLRYDVEGLDEDQFADVKSTILSEPPLDNVYELCPLADWLLATEPLPGQYDQQADSAAQCIQLLTCEEQPRVKCARIYLFDGAISAAERRLIENYLINPLESRKASMQLLESLVDAATEPEDVVVISGFINADAGRLEHIRQEYGYVMSQADLEFCQNYFSNDEQRDPSVTELKLIDTYWSDHCRHTTFNTELTRIILQNNMINQPLQAALKLYNTCRDAVYGKHCQRPVTLMDIACIGAKKLRADGLLPDWEISDENNACSIIIDAKTADGVLKSLLMFKNETHNHPTEIEPFGGAATCLGGAIRDPLSGRAYVFGGLRVTGSADPRQPIAETLPGKLPQRVITTNAAAGFSAYGNQIGLATGKVTEIYHSGYAAKRMEVGAVIAAAPFTNVMREHPQPGDVVILLGGDTGRDGIGGATGSSKAHDDTSLEQCGAEVQKGNPPTERKIQRLFRSETVSRMIKKCNDFGAGGIAVAIGELADSLDIDLSKVPKKYDGLDGTELAVSESQERMAVVVSFADSERFIALANDENLKATVVAKVTDSGRLVMRWRDKVIVDISRKFLDTNGAKTQMYAEIADLPAGITGLIDKSCTISELKTQMSSLEGCLQKGLGERFDSTIGTGTVLLPFGGIHQLTPSEGLAMLLPIGRESETAALMAHGFDVRIAGVSPFHSAVYAVVESVCRIVAMGGDCRTVRLSLQEYFERLEREPLKWGKPLAALLGALTAQLELGIAAIGGKDSMSGSFNELHVPPTLVSFAVATAPAGQLISNEFKSAGNNVYLIQTRRDVHGLPDWNSLRDNLELLNRLVTERSIVSAQSVKGNGALHALAEMAVGNNIGVEVSDGAIDYCKNSYYGDFLIEIPGTVDCGSAWLIGKTIADKIIVAENELTVADCATAMLAPLEKVFPTTSGIRQQAEYKFAGLEPFQHSGRRSRTSFAKPRVFIPVFPGTNCEYDSARAFEKAGAVTDTFVFKNLSAAMVEQSIIEMANGIGQAQILMLPGGFSAADEPDGSGKFIATILRNAQIKAQIEDLLARDGLILGICNGFQALIKSGLLPFGAIHVQRQDDPTLTFNTIGRHISTISRIKVLSGISPWLAQADFDTIYNVPLSHGEGRFVCSAAQYEQLRQNGQIATCYVDLQGQPALREPHNPNGSMYAVEGLTSMDGRIFGKMGHSERCGKELYKNLPGEYDMRIFAAGVDWFK